MNTQTQDFLISRDERRAFEAAWRNYVATGKADAPAFILQAIFRGRDPKRGFAPVTNAVKRANGQATWHGYRTALSQLRWHPDQYVQALWPELKAQSPARYEAILKSLAPVVAQLQREA